MKIVLTGPKGTGKSTLGKELATLLGIPFVETDHHIEHLYASFSGKKMTCREIYRAEGESAFREMERRAVLDLAMRDWCIVSTGGATMLSPQLRRALGEHSCVVLLRAADELLWERITATGIPPFLEGDDGFARNVERNRTIYEAIERIADLEFAITKENEARAHEMLLEELSAYFMLKMHSPSTFGEIIRTSTFGESHGPALGAVMDGVRAGIELSEADIQRELDRRRPGQSGVTTPRMEDDRVEILAGVFEGKTTGTPLCMVVYNRDQDSSKYDALRTVFRPGHADFTFWKKFGLRDHRGGGRSSGRETIGRVASGAVAKKILAERGIEIIAFAQEIGGIAGVAENPSCIEQNPVRAADPDRAGAMEQAIHQARQDRDSLGGIVKIVIRNVPAGLGDPVFFKLDARLAMAFFSIGAVKGVEIGAGFTAAAMKGSENNDQMSGGSFLSNNAGGLLGGISTCQEIIARVAVKPTPSIARDQMTGDIDGMDRTIAIEGRHDPCIVPRIIPVIEAMAALVIADALCIQEQTR
jgi:chorismate synthase